MLGAQAALLRVAERVALAPRLALGQPVGGVGRGHAGHQLLHHQPRVAELQQYIQQVDEAEAKEAALVQKIDVITDLKNKQSGPVEVMDEVSKALPELLWVDRLDQQGSTFTLSGRAFNDQAVSNFLANLDAVPEFEEPFLRDMQRPSGSDVFNYTINFTKITTSTEDEDERYDTIGGFVLGRLDRIPVVGDEVDVDKGRFRVTQMDGRRIEYLLFVTENDRA